MRRWCQALALLAVACAGVTRRPVAGDGEPADPCGIVPIDAVRPNPMVGSLPRDADLERLIGAGAWTEAVPVVQDMKETDRGEDPQATRSERYRRYGIVAYHTGELRSAAESFVIAMEIQPKNLTAARDFIALARVAPDAYDFDAIFVELRRIYMEIGFAEGVALLDCAGR